MASAWQALSDPNRRAVLELLLERPRPVGELVERLGLTQPGTSKHLKVLCEAGLVRARQDAQRRVYELDPAPIAELDAWLAPYRRLWADRLDALGRHLDEANPNGDQRHTGTTRRWTSGRRCGSSAAPRTRGTPSGARSPAPPSSSTGSPRRSSWRNCEPA